MSDLELGQDELSAVMREIGTKIHDRLPEGVGFALVIFEARPGGNAVYLSNATREDMVKIYREVIARFERSSNGEEG